MNDGYTLTDVKRSTAQGYNAYGIQTKLSRIRISQILIPISALSTALRMQYLNAKHQCEYSLEATMTAITALKLGYSGSQTCS
jgi:hypothetical protein